MIPLLCRMWTELPQAVCVQDPQQLQRREEEATVKRLPARRHLVCRSSTFHWLQPGTAGGGGSAALAWNHSLVVFISVGFLVVVFFEWVKMYAQTSLAVVQPQYTHTYTHTCTFLSDGSRQTTWFFHPVQANKQRESQSDSHRLSKHTDQRGTRAQSDPYTYLTWVDPSSMLCNQLVWLINKQPS